MGFVILFVLFLVGYGIGRLILNDRDGEHAKYRTRRTVGVLAAACLVAAAIAAHVGNNSHNPEMYGGVLATLVALALGLIGAGLLFALILRLFSTPPGESPSS